jgi:hypothetical protein
MPPAVHLAVAASLARMYILSAISKISPDLFQSRDTFFARGLSSLNVPLTLSMIASNDHRQVIFLTRFQI